MSYNYAVAGDFFIIVHALAIVESNENANLIGDDDGLAFGLLQQHPAFFFEFYGHGSFPAADLDSWATAQMKAAASYLEKWLDLLGLDGAVTAYNVGVAAYQGGERNANYLGRFKLAYAGLNG